MNKAVLTNETGKRKTLCNCKYEKIQSGNYKISINNTGIGKITVGDKPTEMKCEELTDGTNTIVNKEITVNSTNTKKVFALKDSFGKTVYTFGINVATE